MKLFKLLPLSLVTLFFFKNMSAQTQGSTNASLNILTANSGIVNQGSILDLSISITNTGANPILANKIRVQIAIPNPIAAPLPTAAQTSLSTNWIVTSNTAVGVITICNSTDIIPAGQTRISIIKVQGNNVGGPFTINAGLAFGTATSCTGFGSLPGDLGGDNTSTTGITVVPSCPLTVSASAGTILCNNGTTIITAIAAGATGAVEYSITGGASFQAGNAFTVPAGTYNVLARQISNTNCSALSNGVTILQPTAVAPPTVVAITQPTCSITTGSVSLSGLPSGTWTINPGNILGSGTGTTISGLVSGSYNFIVTNAAGCSSIATALVINAQPVTPAIPIVGTVTLPSCTAPTGSVILNGLPSGFWTISPGNITGTGSSTSVSNLLAGTYNFTVTNADGCISNPTADVVINLVTGILEVPLVTIIQPTCTKPNGFVAITSPTAGLTFSINSGIFASYPAGGYTLTPGIFTLTAQNSFGCISNELTLNIDAQPSIPVAAISIIQPSCAVENGLLTVTSSTIGLTFSLNGAGPSAYPSGGYILAQGIYTLTAQNISGCTSTQSNIIINPQPGSPSGIITAGVISCNAGTTTLTVNAFGGTAPYEYSLDGIDFQTSNIFTVGPGTFTVTIKSANACSATTDAITLIQPADITVAAVSGTIACNGERTNLTVTSSGGRLPLQYSLNAGAFQTSNTFIVNAGTQTIIVKDANGCIKAANVVTVNQPAVLRAMATAPRISACGLKTEITVTATGGSVPYTGIGKFIRDAGIFTFVVSDVNGCTSTIQIDIEAPGCMDLQGYPNPTRKLITIIHTIAEVGATMQLFTIQGQTLLTIQVPVDAFKTNIDLRKFPVGMYIAVFQNGKDRKSFLFEKIN